MGARGFVTYCGAGTVYLDDSNVDFDEFRALRRDDESIDDYNDRVPKDPKQVKEVGTGDMILIKGNKYPDGSGGLVHRSPAMEHHADGSIKHRLCLKVDVVHCGEHEH